MRRVVVAALITLLVFAVTALLIGCGPVQMPQPQPCNTYFDAERGEWMEEDREPMDDDPCDREPDSKPSSKAPAAKPTPKKTSAPIGGKTKKF